MITTEIPLGQRMKSHEAEVRQVLPPRTLKVVRVDGRAFHTYTRDLERPFDAQFAADMDAVALSLAMEIDGAVLAYTQSDEISVLFYDYATTTTQPWLGGVVAKIVSLTAARATATFAVRRPPAAARDAALFDSRVFTLPDPHEAAAYLLSRQNDAATNSVAMAAQARFSHAELQGKSVPQMLDMLRADDAPWEELPDAFKRGRVTLREDYTEDVTFTHPRTGEATDVTTRRSRWVSAPAPAFTTDPDGWLRSVLPGPDVRAGSVIT